jgi:hypothetical protein
MRSVAIFTAGSSPKVDCRRRAAEEGAVDDEPTTAD